MEDFRKYLDPKVLSKISRMDIKARLIVEGFISGLHRSPFHGFSVEFVEHRQYVPGDDIKHIDWRVFGKRDKFYVKLYEEETNLRCYILLDTSESMRYKSNGITKYEYGCYVASSLAYLLIQQQDAVGLGLFDSHLRNFLPASANPANLNTFLKLIDEVTPSQKTEIRALFHRIAEEIKRRGMVIIISDLFTEAEELLGGLRHFRYKGHEVLLFHILDEYELTFPFKGNILFRGLEEHPELLTDTRSLKDAYLKALNEFIETIRSNCMQNRIDYTLISTSDHLDIALSSFLAKRMKER